MKEFFDTLVNYLTQQGIPPLVSVFMIISAIILIYLHKRIAQLMEKNREHQGHIQALEGREYFKRTEQDLISKVKEIETHISDTEKTFVEQLRDKRMAAEHELDAKASTILNQLENQKLDIKEQLEATLLDLLEELKQTQSTLVNQLSANQLLDPPKLMALSPAEKEQVIQPIEQIIIHTRTFRHTLQVGGQGPEMTVVPPGCFWMGSYEHDNEKPIHQVTISYSFAISKYPITFDEYDKFCDLAKRWKPEDANLGRGKRAVYNVTWEDAHAYCQWLSQQTGQHYRLPSESEWEYACRAGTTTRFSFGDSENNLQEYAWFSSNFGNKTHGVGEKKPNSWGLYDMHGNVWEWCEDTWHNDYHGAPTDGSAWLTGSDPSIRLLRGGCWLNNSNYCRCANRSKHQKTYKSLHNGFRIVASVTN